MELREAIEIIKRKPEIFCFPDTESAVATILNAVADGTLIPADQCYEVREGYAVCATIGETDEHSWRDSDIVLLSEALTIRSAEEVRREALEEAAKLADVYKFPIADLIRDLIDTPAQSDEALAKVAEEKDAAIKQRDELAAEVDHYRTKWLYELWRANAAEAERDELAAIHDELAGMRDEDGFLGTVAQWIEDIKLERDQALAAAAAREIAMRDRVIKAFRKHFDKPGPHQMDEGGWNVVIGHSKVESLPLSPDATAALNEMLADAWDGGRLSSALDRNPYRP